MYKRLYLAVLVSMLTVTLSLADDDPSDAPSPSNDMKKASVAELLCRHWVHSREEEKPGDIGQLFRPAGSKKFPPSRFRMAYTFSKDGHCTWNWLSPYDGHEMKPATWSLDTKDPKILRIDKGKKYGGKKAFRIIELSKAVLRLKKM